MNVLVVYAHPHPASFGAALRDQVVDTLSAAGHRVDLIDLYREGFDPLLSPDELAQHRAGLAQRPTLAGHARLVAEAKAVVLVYPTWWGGPPAMLKGWFDRVLCEGVAYRLPPGKHRIRPSLRHIKHLVVVTSYGSPRWINALQGEPGRRMVRWGLRTLLHPLVRTQWIALYDMDRNTNADRVAFLRQLTQRLQTLGAPSRVMTAHRRPVRTKASTP